ncbi:MAG: exodeoxyribonuclease III [Vampirovibrionales bacterium]|nr:exodeoxyribonuclease III [Vampirovibrionales bacterium]
MAPESSPTQPSAASRSIKLVSWNVNGFRAVMKKGFCEWMEAAKPDILGLQETKLSAEHVSAEMQCAGYTSYWTHAEKKGYSGVAIYTKIPPISVSEGLGIPEFDREGRVLVAEYPEFVFYTIYYPNGQRSDERLQYKLAFYDAFLEHANAMRQKGKRLVICGDVNTAHHPIDLARPKENEKVSGFLPIERAWMDKFVAEGYVDTFREFNQNPAEYSWWNMRTRARERNVGWRIDYFFVSDDLRSNLYNASIEQAVMGSDHCPVTLELRF